MIGAKIAAIALLSYLLGAIPCGLLIGKALKGIDVRELGSGKTGASNVLRTAGAKAALLTLITDVGKGILAVSSARWIMGAEAIYLGNFYLDFEVAQVVAAWSAIIGHNWSIYIKFGGGRGVDTFFGGLIGMSPLVGLGCGIFTLAIMAITRYVSLGSILGTIATVLATLSLTLLLNRLPMEYLLYTILAASLILFQHRDNIQRLLAKKERKLGEKAGRISPSPPISEDKMKNA